MKASIHMWQNLRPKQWTKNIFIFAEILFSQKIFNLRFLKIFNNQLFHILLISFLVCITRIAYLFSPSGQIGDADEAVFGLMALQIMRLEEFPIYCWGAHYAGTPICYLAAIMFKLFGYGFVQLRMAMLPVTLFSTILFYQIYRKLFDDSQALMGAIFLIFCPFFVLRLTMSALGGYGETFLGISLIVLLSWKIKQNGSKDNMIFYLLLGIISGFFLYILFLVLPAVIVFGLSLLLAAKKYSKKLISSLLFFIGNLIGIFPMIIYNIMNQGGTFLRAAGRSTDLGREAISIPLSELSKQIILNKLNYLKDWVISAPELFGVYLLPSEVGNIFLKIAGFFILLLLIYFVILSFTAKMPFQRKYLLKQFAWFLIILLIFQWIANLNRSRHLLPITLIIPIALFTIINFHVYFKKTIILLLLLSIWCSLQLGDWCNRMNKSSFNPYPIISVMEDKKITRFYGSYWTTYPIMFASKAKLIGAPYLLPFSEILGDRSPDWTQKVLMSKEPAFVFAKSEHQLMDEFVNFITKNNISSASINIKGVTIFWNLSKPVRAKVNKTKWKTQFIIE